MGCTSPRLTRLISSSIRKKRGEEVKPYHKKISARKTRLLYDLTANHHQRRSTPLARWLEVGGFWSIRSWESNRFWVVYWFAAHQSRVNMSTPKVFRFLQCTSVQYHYTYSILLLHHTHIMYATSSLCPHLPSHCEEPPASLSEAAATGTRQRPPRAQERAANLPELLGNGLVDVGL